MRDRTSLPRVVILANRLKKPVVEALAGLRPWLRERARIVAEPDITRPDDHWVAELPEADLAIVLGGDGTLLAQARHLLDLDLAILGVNFGKLGFLAEFSVEDLRRHWDRIAGGRCRSSQRLVLDVQVFDADAADCRVGMLDMDRLKARSVAVNDAVITAGPPFRMIELELAFDPVGKRRLVTRFAGDGVIVATSSGSTAYNTSAGGPILSPDIEALCVTPICPQSLAFRPVVVNAASAVAIRVSAANAGTALVIDGQISVKLEVHEQVYVCRHPRTVRLIENPRHTYWWTLARKMHWAARPSRA